MRQVFDNATISTIVVATMGFLATPAHGFVGTSGSAAYILGIGMMLVLLVGPLCASIIAVVALRIVLLIGKGAFTLMAMGYKPRTAAGKRA